MHAHVSEKKSEIRCFWSLDEKKHINTDISFDTTHSLSFISFGLVSIGLRLEKCPKVLILFSFCSEDDYLSFRLSDMWLRQLFLCMHC